MALRRLGLLEANLQAKFEYARLTKNEHTCILRPKRAAALSLWCWGRIFEQ